ncbi:MAG TPA: sugar ABC transporter permease, partial [Microbacterium sp.]|nr:sugar ABC transporter permease [Microbacterium sp.]
VTTATQVGTVGVDEVLGEPGSPNRPAPRSLQARRPSSRRVLTRTLLNVAAAIVFGMSVFPVYWMINMSLTPNSEIITREPSFLPFDFTLQNYLTAWTREAAPGQTDFPHALMTSLTVTAG